MLSPSLLQRHKTVQIAATGLNINSKSDLITRTVIAIERQAGRHIKTAVRMMDEYVGRLVKHR
jgi:hypothetical protein